MNRKYVIVGLPRRSRVYFLWSIYEMRNMKADDDDHDNEKTTKKKKNKISCVFINTAKERSLIDRCLRLR